MSHGNEPVKLRIYLFLFSLSEFGALRCRRQADLFRNDLEGQGDSPCTSYTETLLQLAWLGDVISSILGGGGGGGDASDLPRQYSCNLIAPVQRSLSALRFPGALPPRALQAGLTQAR